MLAPDAITKFFGKVQLKRDVASTATGVKNRTRLIRPRGDASPWVCSACIGQATRAGLPVLDGRACTQY